MYSTIISGFFQTLDFYWVVQKYMSAEVEILEFVRLFLQQLSDAVVFARAFSDLAESKGIPLRGKS